MVGVGNVAGFISAWIFRTSEAPRYRAGMEDGLIMTILAAVMLAGTWVYNIVHNERIGKDGSDSDTTAAPERDEIRAGTARLGKRTSWKYRP